MRRRMPPRTERQLVTGLVLAIGVFVVVIGLSLLGLFILLATVGGAMGSSK